MAQKQIELALEYQKNLKRKTISEEKKDKVKRVLFTDERPLSPGPVQRSNTPLSYDCVGDGSQTIFFIGYKYPQDQLYRCERCFTRDIKTTHQVELEIILHQNCTYGEKNYLQFLSEGYSELDCTNRCDWCSVPLYIIRSYHSDHLDFA